MAKFWYLVNFQLTVAIIATTLKITKSDRKYVFFFLPPGTVYQSFHPYHDNSYLRNRRLISLTESPFLTYKIGTIITFILQWYDNYITK